MEIELVGHLDDVQTYNGKNGFGANVVMSQKVGKRTKTITFNTKDKAQADALEEALDTDVIVKIDLVQNNFGLRLGNIISIGA